MGASEAYWLTQLLHGLQLSMLLFLVSIGLSIVFGLLHFVNLAHGALYAFGAYMGYSIAAWTGSFWTALFLAPPCTALLGYVLYSLLIKKMRHAGPLNQVLVTFGLIFIALDLTRLVWGDFALGLEPPALLQGPVTVFGVTYSLYRYFFIAAGFAVMGLLFFVLHHTMTGAMIRAAVDNGPMASTLGIDTDKVFLLTFCVGCALAGLAGILAAPILSITPEMGTNILISSLIVVVIGGTGSLKGVVLASFLVGYLQTAGAILAPEIAAILVYALLAAVLLFRPQGLFLR